MFHLQSELGLVSVSCSSQNLLQLDMCGVLVSVLWSVDSGRVDYWTVVDWLLLACGLSCALLLACCGLWLTGCGLRMCFAFACCLLASM